MVVCAERRKKTRRSLQTRAFENNPSVRHDVNKTKTSQCCNVMCNINKVQILSAGHKIFKISQYIVNSLLSFLRIFELYLATLKWENIWFHKFHPSFPSHCCSGLKILKISKMFCDFGSRTRIWMQLQLQQNSYHFKLFKFMSSRR